MPDVVPPPAPVACLIVNWNHHADTAACLDSLRAQDYQALQVVVVDNGSTDGSLATLGAAYPWVHFMDAGANLGFPRACNLAATHPVARAAKYLWFLNNDTVAPPDTLTRLIGTAKEHPRAGVIGAVLYFLHHPSRIQAWGGGSISLRTGYNRHYSQPTPMGKNSYITFASALVPKQVFDLLGGLYEGAFMYFEDADFCMRAQRAGYTLAVSPGTAILHHEGASAPSSSPHVVRTTTVAGVHFLRRHARLPALACTVYVLSRIARRVLRLNLPGIRAVIAGAREARKPSSAS